MNLDIFESTFAAFSTNWTPNKSKYDNNCPGDCSAQIKGLAWWLENKPFWTYHCACCNNYQFLEGQVTKGGFNE